MTLYEQMDREELEMELRWEQDFHAFMISEQPGETYIITKTQERIDKLQKILKSNEK